MTGQNLTMFLVGALLLGVGLYAVLSPERLGSRIAAFYRSYPLVRYAAANQFEVRKGFVRTLGVLFIVLAGLALTTLIGN